MIDTTQLKDGMQPVQIGAVAVNARGELVSPALVCWMNIVNGYPDVVPFAVPYTLPEGSTASTVSQTLVIGWGFTREYQNVYWDGIPQGPVAGTLTARVWTYAPQHERLVVELDGTHDIPATAVWPAQTMQEPQVLSDTDPDERNDWETVTIDTTQLADGWHSLAGRNENPVVSSHGDVGSGVTKFWFKVENGTPPPPPPPTDPTVAELQAQIVVLNARIVDLTTTLAASEQSAATRIAALQAAIDAALAQLAAVQMQLSAARN